jgi:hypothetical protein
MVLMSKFEIKYNDKRMIIEAENMEKALEQFKELKIDVPSFEISISKFGEYRK